MLQNGTTTAHGRTWPLFERDGYSIEIIGAVEADDLQRTRPRFDWSDIPAKEQRERADQIARYMERRIQEVVDIFAHTTRVKVKVSRTMVLDMHPEDRAEKEALDEAALAQ